MVKPKPPWRQPRGKTIVSLVNLHTNATSKRWNLWEIDLRFALNSTPGWVPLNSCDPGRGRIVEMLAPDYSKGHLPDIEQWSQSSGSNVIPRRARPGLAGLRPHRAGAGSRGDADGARPVIQGYLAYKKPPPP